MKSDYECGYYYDPEEMVSKKQKEFIKKE